MASTLIKAHLSKKYATNPQQQSMTLERSRSPVTGCRDHRREKNETGQTRSRVHVAEKGSGNSRADRDEAIANESDS